MPASIAINMTLFGVIQINQLSASCVLYLILVSFWKNRQTYYGVEGWYSLLRHLDLSCVDNLIIAKYYQRKPKYAGLSVLFLFLCWLFEIPHTELAAFLNRNQDRFWFRLVPIHNRILQTVSEFVGQKGRHIDPHDLRLCFDCLIEQIFQRCRVDQLTDDDLFAYAGYFTFRRAALDLPSQATGGHYFANFIFSLGLGAAMSLCQQEDDQRNSRLLSGFGYSISQLVGVILGTPGCKNVTQLAKELRLTGADGGGLSPSSQVLGQFVKDLDKNKVVSFYERFGQSVRRFKKLSKIVVAIDATIIEVFGDYEQATWIYDHDRNKSVRGYKLYLAFDVTNKVPLGYFLGGSESECRKLLELVELANKAAGSGNIEFTVFDRGYFDTSELAKLDDQGDTFLTIAKKCKTFKDIIQLFEKNLARYTKIREDEWRVSFYLADFIDFTADEGMRLAKVTLRRRLVVKTKKDPASGERIETTRIEHLIYLTNSLAERHNIESMVANYGQRVAIENFFEELKNAYRVKGFPTTSYDGVVSYITLILIQQLLLWLFCSLLTSNEADTPYRHKELTTLKFELLKRPAHELFDLTEPDDVTRAAQKAIKNDVDFIKNFRRFIQKTKERPPLLSLPACIMAGYP